MTKKDLSSCNMMQYAIMVKLGVIISVLEDENNKI